MMMRITLHECKKAFTSPVLIALMLLFAAFNVYLIVSQSYYSDELLIANDLAEKYGVQITDESLRLLEEDLTTDVAGFNDETTQSPLQLKEMYLDMARSIDEEYAQLDWMKIGHSEIHKYRLSGSAAETLKHEYDKLSVRFEELTTKDEHKTWFFPGNFYKMHSFLFQSLFRSILFETMMLIVLATALITNYEFEHNTHLVTFATRRGRGLMKDKLAASLLTTTAMFTFILVTTLTTYFSVFDYSHVWETSINSAFNWEYGLPYVAWWDLSFLAFLLWSILLLYVCMLLFAAITYFISVFVKNSYFTFFIFSAFFAIVYMMTGFVPTSSHFIFISAFNLSTLVVNPHYWFMGNSGLTIFKYYELITVTVWTLITAALCLLALKVFKKQEIH